MTNRLSPSLEDYLEAAYALCSRDGYAKPAAIARRLKVSAPSVNSAVKALAARGLLLHEHYGAVCLTHAGAQAGAEIAGRHGTLKDFFTALLAMSEADAERDACRAEHALSPEALARLAALAAFLKGRPTLYKAARRAVGKAAV